MKLPISTQVLISAFTDMLVSPIYNVSYVYLETESTIKKEIEKWNNDIDNDIDNDPTGWHPNKREWNPDNYPKVGRDLYAVTYVRAVKSYNITFKDFVCGFLEIKDEDLDEIADSIMVEIFVYPNKKVYTRDEIKHLLKVIRGDYANA